MRPGQGYTFNSWRAVEVVAIPFAATGWCADTVFIGGDAAGI